MRPSAWRRVGPRSAKASEGAGNPSEGNKALAGSDGAGATLSEREERATQHEEIVASMVSEKQPAEQPVARKGNVKARRTPIITGLAAQEDPPDKATPLSDKTAMASAVGESPTCSSSSSRPNSATPPGLSGRAAECEPGPGGKREEPLSGFDSMEDLLAGAAAELEEIEEDESNVRMGSSSSGSRSSNNSSSTSSGGGSSPRSKGRKRSRPLHSSLFERRVLSNEEERTALMALVALAFYEDQKKKPPTYLYRFSRRELAVSLFAHIATNRAGMASDGYRLHALVSELMQCEQWDDPSAGERGCGRFELDLNAVCKSTLARLCVEYDVPLKPIRRSAEERDKRDKPDKPDKPERSDKLPSAAVSEQRTEEERESVGQELAGGAEEPEPYAGSGSEDDAEPSYCVCGSEFTHKTMMACSGGSSGRCHGWVHPECVGVSLTELPKNFTCPLCANAKLGRHIDLVVLPKDKQEEREDESASCALCGSAAEHDPLLGDFVGAFLPTPKDAVRRGLHKRTRLWCHSLCAGASDGAGLTEEGLWYNVSEVVGRASSVPCRICGELGASVRSQRKGAVTPGWAHLKCVFDHGKNKTVRAVRRQLEAGGAQTLPARNSPNYERLLEERADEHMLLMEELKQSLVWKSEPFKGLSAIQESSFSDVED